MQESGVTNAGNGKPQVSGSPRRPEILCLTSVRSVAALAVVLFHTLFELGGSSAAALPGAFSAVITDGGAAVSFFFVLSGFVLAYTYCDDDGGLRGAPSRFWRARFARIYPLYALGFVIDTPRVVSFFLSSVPSVFSALVKISVAGGAYLTLLQSWHPRVTNTWNTPGWSLSTEAFFYAVFPALLGLTRGWRFRVLFASATAIWALPIVLHAFLGCSQLIDLHTPSLQTLWRSFPPLRLPEFALGVVTGRFMLSGRLGAQSMWLRWSGALALFLIVLVPASSVAFPALAAEVTLRAPLFALAILALASGALPTPRWLNGDLPVLLGRASYGVYILHQPLKTVFLAAAHRVRLDTPSPALLCAFVVSLELTCVGLFRWFEEPLRRVIAGMPPVSGR